MSGTRIAAGRTASITFLLLLASFMLLGILNYRQNKAAVIEEFRKTSLQIRDSVISQINYESFTEIHDEKDMESSVYKDLQERLDTVCAATAARYLYTANISADGTYVYAVDGLPVDAKDFAKPGTPIEKELFEYMEKSLNGESAVSNDFMDTEWGTVCTAYFPISDEESGVYGVLCMEFDMEQQRQELYKRFIIFSAAALLVSMVLSTLVTVFYVRLKKSSEEVRNARDEVDRRLRIILDGISGGFKISRDDEKYSYTFVSEAAAGIQGYTVEEFLEASNGNAVDNVYKPDLEGVLEDLRRQFEKGDSYSCKYRVLHKDGSTRWIVDNGKRFVKDNGEKFNYSLYQDVTEFEEQNIKLNDTYTMLHQMLSSLSNGIIAYELPSHDLLMVNEEAKRIFGLSGDITAARLRDYVENFVMPDNRNLVYGAVNNIKNGGDGADYTFRVRKDNGETVIVQTHTKLLHLADGTNLVLSCMLDITERSLLDEALRQERSQYRNALTNNCEYFYSFDVTEGLIYHEFVTSDGVNPVRYFNKELPAEFDEINRLCAKEWDFEFISEDMLKYTTHKELIEQFEKGCTKTEVEYHTRNKNKYIRATTLMSRRAEDGHILGFVFANDITGVRMEEERKKKELLEAKLALEEAYEAANRASAAKSDFLSRMSHDIRTPMNGIIGMTAIARAHMDDAQRISDCLDKITVSSKYLLGLINQALDMSKIESGKLDLSEEEFNISGLVDDLVTMTKPQIAKKRHELIVTDNGITHELVIGDSQHIQQCFVNLMSNAVKYTPDGGRIKFSFAEKPTNNPMVGCYEFVFEDNGIGMSEEFKSRIFEPFSRADDARVQKIQGTGLGMAITRNIVRMMDGNIDIDSEQGKGTKVTVTIYLEIPGSSSEAVRSKATEQDAPSTIEGLSSENFNGRRVLLVEDNELNAEIAGEILGAAGIEIDYAKDGKEAVDIMSRVAPGYYDIIFSDIQMPVMNGYEAARAIRALPGDYPKNVPIVAMTANAFAEDVRAAMDAGMNEHIMKPIDIKQIAGVLRKWMR